MYNNYNMLFEFEFTKNLLSSFKNTSLLLLLLILYLKLT